ncbi:methylated-DNA--[protein]-cysteine S-methyltransferase [Wenzhouxiangella sp. XN79A]|uniref:methylated-DNA--[protein]-cysteine S-methyltransferase n=1 Tax=Wenzhouxiangella sp. XN79A TaxID=2724193 RepID=UPI00144AAF12|nr:methylated-DNA--[protein]-cysteine S-methyltransferase [Wenzhouxiangella sp. XN79A]NKI36171.1 methylated-DNA--[protein]-cysteine S-methyltransferase [Wenzhouxiangella sp. XN79A]
MTAALDTRLLAACRRALDESDARVADLAAAAGMSAGHFQRAFKQALGVTPGEFLRAGRLERFRAALGKTGSVTEAVHAAGFGSTSRAHQAAGEGLGMAPSRARQGGHGERIDYATSACRLGRVLVAATSRGLCAVLLGDDDLALEAELRARFPKAGLQRGGPAFRATLDRVAGLVDTPAAPPADLPLDIAGTAFQRRAWKALQQIPAGETVTYAELARRMGHPNAHRAAAAACGANPLAVVIPCHRVVRSDGELGGYRWGVERKRALLNDERSLVSVRSAC